MTIDAAQRMAAAANHAAWPSTKARIFCARGSLSNRHKTPRGNRSGHRYRPNTRARMASSQDSHTMYHQAKAATTRGLPRKKAAKGKTSAPLPLPTTKVYRHSAAEKKMTPAGTKPGKKQKKKKAAAGAAKSSAAVMSPRTRSRNFGQL